jgi:hypothetical protein
VSAIRGVSIQIGASSGVKILVPFTSNGHESNHVGMDSGQHSEDVSSTHHAEGLFNPKVLAKKTDF